MNRADIANQLKTQNTDTSIDTEVKYMETLQAWLVSQGVRDEETILNDLESYPEYGERRVE